MPRAYDAHTSTFSNTLMSENGLGIWYVRPMPWRQRSCRGTWVTSRPLNTTRPSSGRWTPVMRLNRVVLPAPFGPMMPSASPSFNCTLRSSITSTPPNDFLRPAVSRTTVTTVHRPVSLGPRRARERALCARSGSVTSTRSPRDQAYVNAVSLPVCGICLLYTSDAADDVSTRFNSNGYVVPLTCLLYTSDAADDLLCVDLGGR